MKKLFVILALIMLVAYAFADDVMANGGFENWTGGVPDSWTTIDSGINVTQETTTIHGGTSSANIEVTTGSQSSTDFRQSVAVTNGTEYNISVWVYHTEGHEKARLYVNGYQNYSDPAVIGAWQELTYTYTATADGNIDVGLRFYDISGFDNSEIVYVDDFTMTYTPASSTEPVITSIVNTPTLPSSSETVNVSADITDDGTIASAKCLWGLVETALTDSMDMTVLSGDTYQTSTAIPAQANGTTVYYQVKATDNDNNTTVSTVRNYTVTDVPTVTIYDIQYTTASPADSPYAGQTVQTSGVVTAVGSGKYFIQDGTGAWNGVYVYDSAHTPAEGDNITITADVSEFYNLTELSNVIAYTVNSTGNTLPAVVTLTTAQISDEQYEGVLVSVSNANCTTAPDTHNTWQVDDGSGACGVNNLMYAFTPTVGTSYNVTGPLYYTWGTFAIAPRYAADISTAGDNTAPTVNSVTASNATTVVVVYSEDVDQTTAETVSNYNITALGINVTGAVLTNSTTVTLTTDALVSGTEYTLTINGVEDLAGNAMSNVNTNFTYTAASNINPGDIIINEIHYNPAGDDVPYEFVELYNSTAGALSLTGITFEDDDGHAVDLTGTTIDANNFVVIAQTDTAYTALTCPVIATGGYFGLSNSGNQLYVKDGTTVIDSVLYDDASPWPTSPDGSGPSLELTNASLDNSLAENWHASYVAGGTPGAVNSTDTTPPTMTSVTVTSSTTIEVLFDEDVDATTAETATNYTIASRVVTVDSAARDASNHALVVLTVSGLVDGNYTLTANGVEDLAGNPCSNDASNFSYNSDTTAPAITSVTASSESTIDVIFDEDVDQTTAETAANYTIASRVVTVNSAVRDAGNHALVTLIVSGMTEGNYTLTVNGVEDLSGNATSNATANFNYTAPVIINQGDIVINEVGEPYTMANTWHDSYIELYNTTESPIDVSGLTVWSIALSKSTSSFVMPAETEIAAGGYLIATRERATFLTDYATYVDSTIVPVASSTTGTGVYIKNSYYFALVAANGDTIDITSSAVPWNSNVYEKTSPTADGTVDTNWYLTYQTAPVEGTPGQANSTNTALAAPTNVAISHDGTTVNITWDAVTGANSYYIYAGTTPTVDTTAGTQIAQVGTNSFSEAVTPPMKYYKVTASDDAPPAK